LTLEKINIFNKLNFATCLDACLFLKLPSQSAKKHKG